MQKSINVTTFRKMLLSAYSLLEDNRKSIDALNVFPVPDGDTGTNMFLTFKSAMSEMNACESNVIETLCIAFNRGALKGARGNSGVILSQIIKGMMGVIMTCNENITPKDFAKAIQEGSDIAYKAVTKPKEGTILTIIRSMAEEAKSSYRSAKTFEEFLGKIIVKAEETLQRTPDMLPILKKAGVVDAGGRGLIVIFSGMYKTLTGEMINIEFVDSVSKDPTSEDNHFNFEDLADIQFAYCTEIFIINIKEKTTEADINTLRSRLMDIGDSVLCIGDLQLIKVHVHTNEPNKVLAYGLQLGELSGVKIENMLQQNRELRQKNDDSDMKEYGIIAVAAGEGLATVFKDIEVDYVISGGQTMNPSANDIATAADTVKAKNIYVLPNNKNIILAAEQSNDITNKNIIVVPTKSVPEGISAALAFDCDASLQENKDNMISAYSNVKSGSVTYAVRTTHVDGFELNMGEIIGLDNNTILAKGNDINDTTIDLIEKMYNESMSNLTLFYGSEVSQEQADCLQTELEEKYKDCDISVVYGGQPIYYYIVSLE